MRQATIAEILTFLCAAALLLAFFLLPWLDADAMSKQEVLTPPAAFLVLLAGAVGGAAALLRATSFYTVRAAGVLTLAAGLVGGVYYVLAWEARPFAGEGFWIGALAVLGLVLVGLAQLFGDRIERQMEKLLQRWPGLAPASFLILPLVVYLVFVIGPTAYSFFFSITDWNGYGADYDFVGMENFERMFTDRLFANAIKNTAIWLAAAMVIPVVGGLALAVGLQGEGWVNRIYKSVFYLPLCLSLVIVGIIWNWVYNPKLGIINIALEAVGLGEATTAWLANPDTALLALIVAWSWQQTGLNMVIFLAGLTAVPLPLVEAAEVDGANRWQSFRHVVLPMLRPATVVVLALTAINALKSFDIIFVTTKGGPFNRSDTLAMFMYSESFRKYKMGYGSAIAVILFLMTLVIIVLYFRQTAKAGELYE